jgi:hypothetical protein
MRKRRISTFERLNVERLNRSPINRKQRRDLARRVAAADPGLRIVNPQAAGIDVGNASHFAAVPPDRDPTPVREFGFWTADLHKMAAWLVWCRIDTVAMQSTGVYWIPLYDILEQHGLRVVLVNARHTQNVPGAQDRRAGVSMADETAHLWMAAGFLPSGAEPGRCAHGLESAEPARGRSRP